MGREDIDISGDIPKIKVAGDVAGNRKSPGDVYIRKHHAQWLKDFVRKGYTVNRSRKHRFGKGKGKRIQYEDTYFVPEKGFLFTSRTKAKKATLHYHAVYAYAQVRKQAPKFLDYLHKSGQKWTSEVAKLRPHSGRATLITELMGEGMTTSLVYQCVMRSPADVESPSKAFFCPQTCDRTCMDP